MVQLFIDGGGFMWPILLIFIIGFAFVGERLYHLIKGLATKEDFADELAEIIQNKGLKAANSHCEGAVGPIANLCAYATERGEYGLESAEKALDQIGAIEMASLEKTVKNLELASKAQPANNKKQQPPKADPNKVYNVPVGDSFTKGPDNAAVTIIEWSDFQ